METNEEYKPYRRLFFAILLQAVQDAKGSGRDAETARAFLREHGVTYLTMAGVSRPETRLQVFLAKADRGLLAQSSLLQRRYRKDSRQKNAA